MSGVWVFKNGVTRLVENPGEPGAAARPTRKALVYVPAAETMASHEALQRRLLELGWERYYDDPALVQFHRHGSVDLISLPADFARFTSVYMYDIVIKNRDHFKVVDVDVLPAAAE
ncbi:Flowering-promoting factor 1-like protein 1 [Dichanthelium oligosanthes]|uniref:Flowering-promoting factor 1-like protein 1 n=1 Tax=Dichanthelium oligosanthes TaxID=888268 RepID=A0A1E5VNW3_9POAL|nr:Flowering-promoting factor 1-like protein 1 [Dichanthelium oligosanthes]